MDKAKRYKGRVHVAHHGEPENLPFTFTGCQRSVEPWRMTRNPRVVTCILCKKYLFEHAQYHNFLEAKGQYSAGKQQDLFGERK